MGDLIREAPFGQLLYYLSQGKLLSYPEEQSDFEFPLGYFDSDQKEIEAEVGSTPEGSNVLGNRQTNLAGTVSHATAPVSTYGADPESELQKAKSLPIHPQKSPDGRILVDWYMTDDDKNPQNWSLHKKVFVTFLICIYSFAVYFGSSVYVPAEIGVRARFGVSEQKATLGLSLYVLAYGLGPLFWSPLSEIPVIGRNVPYIVSFALFIILCIPTAVVDNFGGLCVLRFLLGFFGSPCLATGAASLQDMWSFLKLPYAMTAWLLALYAGPALAPTIYGFAVPVKGFRWATWELLWLSGPIFILFFFFLPETSSATILLRRAKRLRRAINNPKLVSQSEINQSHLTFSAVVIDALIKPTEIAIKDPAVAFSHIYTALIYGIYYSFFEVFPLVYPAMYGFNLGQTGLAFLSVAVGATLGMIIFDATYHFFVEKDIIKNPTKVRPQESSLQPALLCAISLTGSLFFFGWTADPSIHWVVSLIGISLFCISAFNLNLSIFVYLPMSYPQYAASIFAANDAVRSSVAAGAIHFAQPLYRNLGVGKGTSVLGGVSVLGIVGVWVLYFYGARLRARSRFAVRP